MKTLSLGQARDLAQKAAKMEETKKRERLLARLSTERAVGVVAGLIAAPLAGFISGKLDTKFDSEAGDGIKVFGVPAVPVAGAVLAGVGFYMGGGAGVAVAEAGLATLHGALFQHGFRAGGS